MLDENIYDYPLYVRMLIELSFFYSVTLAKKSCHLLGKYLVCRCAAQLIYVLLYVDFNNYLLACHYDSLKAALVCVFIL